MLLVAAVVTAAASISAAAGAKTHDPVVGPARVRLVVVVDDLGYSLAQAERVMALPGEVTLGLLPFAPATAAIAQRARDAGMEMILHQPMESLPAADAPLARGTLTLCMSPQGFAAQIEAALLAVPGIVGINNHTGSWLTQDPESMQRLMQHLAGRGLMFLDSRTTAATVAYRMAREARIPALQRDVFLDHVVEPAAMDEQFQRALAIGRRNGQAIIIAHPHKATLDYLQAALTQLPGDVALVSLRELAMPRPAALARSESPAIPHI